MVFGSLVGVGIGYSAGNNMLGYGAVPGSMLSIYPNRDPRLLSAGCVPIQQDSNQVYEYENGNLQFNFSQAFNQLGINIGAKGEFEVGGLPFSAGGELDTLNETQTSALTVNYIISGTKVSLTSGGFKISTKHEEGFVYENCGPYFTTSSVGQATILYMVSVHLNSQSDYNSFRFKMSFGIPKVADLTQEIKNVASETNINGSISVSYFKVMGSESENKLMQLKSEEANTYSFKPEDLQKFTDDFNQKFSDVKGELDTATMYYRIPNKGEKVFISQGGR